MLQLERYVSIKVLINDLCRIPGSLIGTRLVTRLISMEKVDRGGYVVDYSTTQHTASEYIDIGFINKECRLLF